MSFYFFSIIHYVFQRFVLLLLSILCFVFLRFVQSMLRLSTFVFLCFVFQNFVLLPFVQSMLCLSMFDFLCFVFLRYPIYVMSFYVLSFLFLRYVPPPRFVILFRLKDRPNQFPTSLDLTPKPHEFAFVFLSRELNFVKFLEILLTKGVKSFRTRKNRFYDLTLLSMFRTLKNILWEIILTNWGIFFGTVNV